MRVEWRQDGIFIGIYINGKLQFNIGLGEAIEQLPRYEIMKIVKNCDKTPWLRNWHRPEIINISHDNI